jgi:Flp pilus assembly protein TadG
MTRVEALAIAAPLLVAAIAGLFALVTNYFDDKATAKRQKQKAADVLRQTANQGVSLSELSETEREQLTLLKAFAETVKNAGAVVEQSSRRIDITTTPQRSLENEKR